MKQLNDYRMRLVLVGFVAAVVFGGRTAKADFTFGEPTNLGPTINSSYGDYDICFSPDGLILFFSSNRSGGYGSDDLYVAMRPSIEDPWGEPVNLGQSVNSSYSEIDPGISTDGLSLFFSSNRPGGYGAWDIWLTKRTTTHDDWGEPMNLGPAVNSPQNDENPSLSTDGVSLLFSSNRSGGHGSYDTWISTRDTMGVDWGKPVNLGPSVNMSYYDLSPSISLDGLTLFFCRGASYLGTDIWMTRRNTEDNAWGEPVDLGPTVNSLAGDGDPEISADGLWLFFNSSRSNGYGAEDIWQAPIIPIVDLNSDGIVDAADMCIIVDNWGTDNSLCDIGPMPWGDGVVDTQDLIALAEHLFEEILPFGCVAYWNLDQKEGNIAHNIAGYNHGTCHGEPFWQPTGGKVNGALQFDGVDDYVETDFVLNPESGSFSAFAWIQGGAPGQVIISQADTLTGRTIRPGCTWLGIDSSDGRLMTTLTDPPFTPLVSEFVVTDGQWHHVGVVLVESGSFRFRILYLDGAMVALDTQSVELLSLIGGLYFGAGKTLDTGTFWSGLIDDVRIYDVALTAEEIAVLAQ